MDKKRIFFDMDGCLAVFRESAKVADLYEKGYFESLPAQPNIIEALRILRTKFECYILSSYLSDSPYALKEKNIWLDKHLPEMDGEHRLFIPCGTSKIDFGDYNPLSDVLIDDYGINCRDWSETGGTYIKVSTDKKDSIKEASNHLYTIYPQMTAKTIAKTISEIIQGVA